LAPVRRIDYMLISPSLRVRSAEMIPTDAPDHLPVVAELEIPPR